MSPPDFIGPKSQRFLRDSEIQLGSISTACDLSSVKTKESEVSEAVKKSSKVAVTLPRDETRERLVHYHSTSTCIATFETVSIRRTCFVTVTRWSRCHHAELDDYFGRLSPTQRD